MLDYYDFSLCQIQSSDKDLILQWRNTEKVRYNMYSDHVISEEEHDKWFCNGLVDKAATYLIFQYKENPIGFLSFTNINHFHNRCYWAFYLGPVDIPRGAGAVLEYFALEYAFKTLKIRKLCCEVFVFNTAVIRLHEKFGFVEEGRFFEHYIKNEKYEDIVCLAKFGLTWADEREMFKSRIFGKVGV